ncbi:MAG TPA: dihydrodipicolinate synthase family protein [Opitutaceae bacterium]|nr:dihydrodipicolinate synthase family protein [Opitutaceae bacterium]
MHTRFRGLVAAPFTPFHADGSLNLSAIGPYAALLRANGVTAAFVCGTTGEGTSLTLEERFAVAEKWMESAGDALRVIVHVGHTSLANAARLAGHAARIGAAAISAVAPYFFRPRTNEELAEWCAAVAAAAPHLPFYFYHIPSLTGVDLPMAGFLERAAPMIPSLAGIKFTYEDLADYEACVRFDNGRFDILFGRDEKLIEGLERGAQGAVGSTYNYAAPLYLRLIEHYRRGELPAARELQATAIRMIDLCNRAGVTHLAASKMLMADLGVDCGPVRLPLRSPGHDAMARLRQELNTIGYPRFAARTAPAD